jgi:hypothetical protein
LDGRFNLLTLHSAFNSTIILRTTLCLPIDRRTSLPSSPNLDRLINPTRRNRAILRTNIHPKHNALVPL